MRRSPRVLRLLLAGLLTSAGITAAAMPAHAAGEQVTAWLTTTDDAGGRHVVRGLQAQPAFAFQTGSGGSGENITADENTGYQTFTGGGASFTDTAAWLMNGSGALSATTREAALRKLFSPTEGIGLDVAGGAAVDGTAVQLYDCNGSAAQRWTVQPDGSIQALGKCLDVVGGSTADGARTQLYDCNGTGAQRWSYNATTGDVVNTAANKCLDVTDNSSANGAGGQIWSCTGAADQKWQLR
ncbi:ricin-type beta-trefoil lectin domain protein [Streptomyces sp. NPDC060053]|uniref:ricin-type beta-trefoil lectin domain protein n=1 Tax=Streptomyces sp. NPDC060053 TaxID=3347047 RepID=UPI0036B74B78